MVNKSHLKQQFLVSKMHLIYVYICTSVCTYIVHTHTYSRTLRFGKHAWFLIGAIRKTPKDVKENLNDFLVKLCLTIYTHNSTHIIYLKIGGG